MHIYYQKLGSGNPIIILHGVFGTGDNWITVARALAETHTVYLADQRNHGRGKWSDDFNYDLLAADVKELMEEELLEKATIIGHSMGGKVAMKFAMQNPEMIGKMVIVDIAPKTYSLKEHQGFIKSLLELPIETISSRKEADELLSKSIKSFAIRQFLLKSLVREDNAFSWRLNLKALQNNLGEVGSDLSIDGTFNGETLFVRGAKSDYIMDDDWPKIQKAFSNSELVTVEDAGHWIHAEQPDALLKVLNKFLA